MQIYEKLPLHFKKYFCRFTFFLFVTLLSLNWVGYLVGWLIVYLYLYVQGVSKKLPFVKIGNCKYYC